MVQSTSSTFKSVNHHLCVICKFYLECTNYRGCQNGRINAFISSRIDCCNGIFSLVCAHTHTHTNTHTHTYTHTHTHTHIHRHTHTYTHTHTQTHTCAFSSLLVRLFLVSWEEGENMVISQTLFETRSTCYGERKESSKRCIGLRCM